MRREGGGAHGGSRKWLRCKAARECKRKAAAASRDEQQHGRWRGAQRAWRGGCEWRDAWQTTRSRTSAAATLVNEPRTVTARRLVGGGGRNKERSDKRKKGKRKREKERETTKRGVTRRSSGPRAAAVEAKPRTAERSSDGGGRPSVKPRAGAVSVWTAAQQRGGGGRGGATVKGRRRAGTPRWSSSMRQRGGALPFVDGGIEAARMARIQRRGGRTAAR
ncbi:hypothetical protein Scep_027402 [Stephania cephalantha]|uniref:Uncharacterized protein n=1 Tax=Stephania cephalantha TaxID=152367 RepID=A0AAP0HMI3_9MAGN